jgi:hypothetical protein
MKKSVDGRHKAGHDDIEVVRLVANGHRKRPMWLAADLLLPSIVMAGLVPAIHGLFFSDHPSAISFFSFASATSGFSW